MSESCPTCHRPLPPPETECQRKAREERSARESAAVARARVVHAEWDEYQASKRGAPTETTTTEAGHGHVSES